MKNTLLLIAIASLLTACNTVQGVGQDVKGAGEWTADAAQKTKQKIEEQ